MTTQIHESLSRWRYLWLVALVGLPAMGWHGLLDDYSSEQINESIAAGGLIYGTARGINALVSLLQGTEVNALVLTFSVGEVLDPVNDLIERFSNVVLIALGSLALQKILLLLVSERFFNILLTSVAAIAGLFLIPGQSRYLSLLLRAFLVIAFLRFSLALVVMANSWVDAAFLNEADQARHASMETFQTELRDIENSSGSEAEAESEILALRNDLTALDTQYNAALPGLQKAASDLEKAQAVVEKLIREAGVLCRMTPTQCPQKVIQAKQQVEILESEKKHIAASMDAIEESRKDILAKIDCLELRRRGETCSIWENVPSPPSAAEFRSRLSRIDSSIGEFTDNSINLLMSLLLKTIVIPLLFLYLLLKILKVTWSRI